MKNVTVVPVTPEEEKLYGKTFWVCIDGVKVGCPIDKEAAFQKKNRLETESTADPEPIPR